MSELRWILLVAGLLLIAGIYAWGLRWRQRSTALEPDRARRLEPLQPPAPVRVEAMEDVVASEFEPGREDHVAEARALELRARNSHHAHRDDLLVRRLARRRSRRCADRGRLGLQYWHGLSGRGRNRFRPEVGRQPRLEPHFGAPFEVRGAPRTAPEPAAAYLPRSPRRVPAGPGGAGS